jgi:hypothetical protein
MRAIRTVDGRQWGGWIRFLIGWGAVVLIVVFPGRAWATGSAAVHAEAHGRYPFVTGSIYESTVDLSTLYAQGCGAGGASANGVVILDWGRPAYDNTWGTIDFADNFEPNGAVLDATKAFARGYVDCLPNGSGARISLAMGTNNSCSNEDPRCCPRHRCRHEPPNFRKAGRFWAWQVNGLQAYLSANGLSRHVHASAADDAEPAWDPAFTATYDFLRGFADTYGYAYTMWDFGSLDPGYWTRWKEWTVAYGLKPNIPFPEIYYPDNAVQWEQLDQWAVSHTGKPMRIYGVLSQWANGFDCGFTPRQGYRAMLAQLQSDPATYQASIRYLSDIPCA